MKVKAVGIKDLRNGLSRYIREVRSGTRILILDRSEVVAEIREPITNYTPAADNTLADELEKSGKLVRPKHPKKQCTPSPVTLPPGTAAAYLNADRYDHDSSVR